MVLLTPVTPALRRVEAGDHLGLLAPCLAGQCKLQVQQEALPPKEKGGKREENTGYPLLPRPCRVQLRLLCIATSCTHRHIHMCTHKVNFYKSLLKLKNQTGAGQQGNQAGHAEQQKWAREKIRSVGLRLLVQGIVSHGDGRVGGRGRAWITQPNMQGWQRLQDMAIYLGQDS